MRQYGNFIKFNIKVSNYEIFQIIWQLGAVGNAAGTGCSGSDPSLKITCVHQAL